MAKDTKEKIYQGKSGTWIKHPDGTRTNVKGNSANNFSGKKHIKKLK